MVATPEDREAVRTGDTAGAPASAPNQPEPAVSCVVEGCGEDPSRTVDLSFIDDGPVDLCGDHYEELAARVRTAAMVR